MDISIIIVNYKNKGLTLNCVKSIAEAEWNGLHHEVIVVDNASHDSLGEILAWQYPEVRFIQNGKNLGMGAGNNVGLARARGRYFVIMNPDTIAFPDTFQKLYRFMEDNPAVGVVGPKQFNPNRTVQTSAYRWHTFMTPIYRRTRLGRLPFARRTISRFLMRDYNKAAPRDVDWLLGSCVCLRRRAWEEVGGFDERFFLYFEDTDLCRRFWDKGWRVVYYPEARIIHNHNRASAERPWYAFFMHAAGRRHIHSWFLYLKKWGLKRPSERSPEL